MSDGPTFKRSSRTPPPGEPVSDGHTLREAQVIATRSTPTARIDGVGIRLACGDCPAEGLFLVHPDAAEAIARDILRVVSLCRGIQ